MANFEALNEIKKQLERTRELSNDINSEYELFIKAVSNGENSINDIETSSNEIKNNITRLSDENISGQNAFSDIISSINKINLPEINEFPDNGLSESTLKPVSEFKSVETLNKHFNETEKNVIVQINEFDIENYISGKYEERWEEEANKVILFEELLKDTEIEFEKKKEEKQFSHNKENSLINKSKNEEQK